MTDAPVRPPPKRLADFEIIRRLGAGGMAEVFLAKKRGAEGTFKLLVLKRILPAYGSSRRFRTMFAEEAQLATRLNHPNIVQVYDFQDYGEEGQLLSMEYVEGPDLRKLMRSAQAKGQRIPPYVSAYIIAEVAKGLHYAHERKDEAGKPIDIVHRDVSPQNILMSFDGAVKIADFGIASANLFREEPGVLKGKTAYMSPEQARAERVSRRTDIYSLGVVFHELLTARPLHGAAEGQELLEAVRGGQVEPPSTYVRELPSELEEIVMRALAKNPDERFQTARDMAAAVSRALFQKQQLVDSHVLETTIAELVTREHTSPGAQPGSDGASEAPQGSEALDDLSSVAHVVGTAAGASNDESTGPGRIVGAQRGRVGREVRHVAVVTLRLHGFDQLAVSVGRQQAARVLDQLKATLGEVAFRRGARFAWEAPAQLPGEPELLGTAARALVGLMANPSRAPLDAVWLAIDVHEVIRGASEDLPVTLSASVGIVRGIATGERDRQGHLIQHELQEPATYLADLLGDRAPPGVSWVAGGLYRLVRRDFVWGDAPTIKIDDAEALNLPQDMRIYALLRPHTRQEKLEEMSLAPSDLIGRDAELADLHAAYYGVVGSGQNPGQVSARVVYGEMGIGKTALLAAFLNELPPDARVLRVESSPALSEVPFATISEWVRELTGTRIDQPFEQARDQIADALGEFAGDDEGPEIVERMAELATGRVRQTVDDADVAEARQLIGLGMRRFFARAAVDAPLVVALDGLQWSDRPSLDLILEFLRRAEPLSVLVVLLTRPEDRVSSFIEGLVRIELKGLSAEHQLRLLQTRLGVTQGVRQVCADLLPRAGGNPFFLLEMVDALLERGMLEIREREGQQELVQVERLGDASLSLPSTLEQLIADRLNELPPEEQAVIEWLAVAGGPLGLADLAAVNGEESADAVTRLSARGLCELKVDTIDVRHPLTRDVAYRALDRRRRVRMHRKLGEHLATTPLAKGLTAAIVARHLARGNARDEAARFYLEAADAARASYQTQLAKRCYRRVIALCADGDLRLLEAHEALESICRNQGRWRERRSHLTKLRALARVAKSADWAAITLLRTAQFELDAGRLAKALSSAQRGESVATQANSPVLEVQARTLMAEILHDIGDMQGALAAVDRALATAEGSGVPARLRAEALRLRGTLLRRVGRVHEAVEAQAEAIAVFRQTGVRRLEARAKNSLAYALLVLGRFEDGIALALDAIRIDLAIGGRFQIAKTLSTIGECYASLGDLERGLAYLRRAREAHERYGDRDSRADTLLSMAEILIEYGDLDGAETLVGDAGALTAVTGSAFDSVHEKILRALLARVRGDHSRAVMFAFDARQAAEAQAYVAFHFYAMAIEARARVDMGEEHTGILLATTAMGAIDTLQGSEYGLPTRALGCEALRVARSPQAEEMRERAARYARSLLEHIRDPLFRRSFVERRVVQAVLNAPESRPDAARGVENPLNPSR
ncbi:MAG TPA: protein kinase [Polyangiaceae bacterium]|jgi:serine/threonine protein kinase/tetratricopeptide (TPR) repeat protein